LVATNENGGIRIKVAPRLLKYSVDELLIAPFAAESG
jgi:hypothetical protein